MALQLPDYIKSVFPLSGTKNDKKITIVFKENTTEAVRKVNVQVKDKNTNVVTNYVVKQGVTSGATTGSTSGNTSDIVIPEHGVLITGTTQTIAADITDTYIKYTPTQSGTLRLYINRRNNVALWTTSDFDVYITPPNGSEMKIEANGGGQMFNYQVEGSKEYLLRLHCESTNATYAQFATFQISLGYGSGVTDIEYNLTMLTLDSTSITRDVSTFTLTNTPKFDGGIYEEVVIPITPTHQWSAYTRYSESNWIKVGTPSSGNSGSYSVPAYALINYTNARGGDEFVQASLTPGVTIDEKEGDLTYRTQYLIKYNGAEINETPDLSEVKSGETMFGDELYWGYKDKNDHWLLLTPKRYLSGRTISYDFYPARLEYEHIPIICSVNCNVNFDQRFSPFTYGQEDQPWYTNWTNWSAQTFDLKYTTLPVFIFRNSGNTKLNHTVILSVDGASDAKLEFKYTQKVNPANYGISNVTKFANLTDNTFDNTGGTSTITFSADTKWKLSYYVYDGGGVDEGSDIECPLTECDGYGDWYTIDKLSGDAGLNTITITTQPNTAITINPGNVITANIRIGDQIWIELLEEDGSKLPVNNRPDYFIVKQEHASYFSISADTLELNNVSGRTEFVLIEPDYNTYLYNAELSDTSWCNVCDDKNNVLPNSIRGSRYLRYTENTTGSPREITLNIVQVSNEDSSYRRTIYTKTIIQKA